jgi:RNA polymerase sigma factor (sigma-70 family)
VGSSRRKTNLGRLAGVLLRTQPDENLAVLARDGGDAAFDEIVRRHRASLTAYAGILAPASRAEDVVQESLLKAYAALQDGARPELLRAWLFRIVRNTAIDEHRGVRLHEQLDENYDGVEQPPQALERREQVAALVLAIRDLPAAQREAIVQRELEGRGHEEIGRALEVSPGAVRQLIYRARHSLREAAGALIPVAVIRAASMPGADEAVGGLGMAGAAKLGLAAVLATGTIVAGSAINGHDRSHKAEALELPTRDGASGGSAHQTAAEGSRLGDDRQSREDRGGSASSGRERTGSDDRGSSGEGGGGNSGPGGSGNEGPSGNSGPGSGESSEDHSGPGSGTSGDGGGSGSDDGVSGSGSSGEGSGGGGSSGGSSSGEGSGDAGTSGEGGSGSDDGGTLLASPSSAVTPS